MCDATVAVHPPTALSSNFRFTFLSFLYVSLIQLDGSCSTVHVFHDFLYICLSILSYSLCSRLNQSLASLLAEVETYRQTREVDEDVRSLLSNQQTLSSTTAEYISKESYQAVCR